MSSVPIYVHSFTCHTTKQNGLSRVTFQDVDQFSHELFVGNTKSSGFREGRRVRIEIYDDTEPEPTNEK